MSAAELRKAVETLREQADAPGPYLVPPIWSSAMADWLYVEYLKAAQITPAGRDLDPADFGHALAVARIINGGAS